MIYPVSGIPSTDSGMTKLWMRLCDDLSDFESWPK